MGGTAAIDRDCDREGRGGSKREREEGGREGRARDGERRGPRPILGVLKLELFIQKKNIQFSVSPTRQRPLPSPDSRSLALSVRCGRKKLRYQKKGTKAKKKKRPHPCGNRRGIARFPAARATLTLKPDSKSLAATEGCAFRQREVGDEAPARGERCAARPSAPGAKISRCRVSPCRSPPRFPSLSGWGPALRSVSLVSSATRRRSSQDTSLGETSLRAAST